MLEVTVVVGFNETSIPMEIRHTAYIHVLIPQSRTWCIKNCLPQQSSLSKGFSVF